MRLLSVENEELATISFEGGNGKPLKAIIDAGDLHFETESQLSMERRGGDLIAHVRVPGMVKFNIALERKDVKALKGLASGDAAKFLVGALLKG